MIDLNMNREIRVFAPATVANVACGFDILGFAIEQPGDVVILRLKDEPGVRISKITGDGGKLPTDPHKNTAGVAVLSFLKQLELEQCKAPRVGIEIELHKKMPLGSGLGSSAASAVASVFGISTLLNRGAPPNQLERKELLPFAIEGERIACGTAHADNAAPSLFGGFVLIRSYNPLDVVRIPTPEDLYCSIIHPQIEIRTEDARKILKREIFLKDAIVQWGNIAGLIAGLMMSDYELIKRSMQDVIIEPVRSILIPGFQEIKKSAIETGALGCSISGSGPSIFALSRGGNIARSVGEAMQHQLKQLDINCEIHVSKINQIGPKIIN